MGAASPSLPPAFTLKDQVTIPDELLQCLSRIRHTCPAVGRQFPNIQGREERTETEVYQSPGIGPDEWRIVCPRPREHSEPQ